MHLIVLKTSLSYIDIQPSGKGKSVHFFSQSHLFGILKLFLPFFSLSCQEISFLLQVDIHFSSYINFPVSVCCESKAWIHFSYLQTLVNCFFCKKKKISFLIIDSVHDNISKTPISFVNFKGFMQSLRSQGCCYRVPEEENSREDRISHLESLFTGRGAVPGRGEAAHHFQPEFLRQGLQSWHIQKGHSGQAAASIHRSRVTAAKWSGGSHNL